MSKPIEDVKILCIKDFLPFVKDNEYLADSRTLINQADGGKYVLVTEKTDEFNEQTCYILSLEEIFEHFKVVN